MLVVESVNFNFGSIPILRDISFRCEQGETVGIVGRSGVGKTTLLNLICGILTHQLGEISLDGTSPAQAANSQQIGYVFQTPTLLPWLTIWDNTSLPLKLQQKNSARGLMQQLFSHKKSKDEDVLEATRSALLKSHIIDAANKLPSELSGGMQTRASIARAIVYKPKLLLLDEPFAALDDIVKERLYLELQEVTSSINCATLLVTHNLNEALVLCDRIYVLKKTKKGGATLVHCEKVAFPKPRGLEIMEHTDFFRARVAMRENLE